MEESIAHLMGARKQREKDEGSGNKMYPLKAHP
jgi:hypothetical protein